jgi:hypothetical protein
LLILRHDHDGNITAHIARIAGAFAGLIASIMSAAGGGFHA